MPGNESQESARGLDSINASQLERVSDKPDVKTVSEELAFEKDRNTAFLQSFKQDTEERKKYAGRIFWVCAGWVSAIWLLLVANGIGYHFKLSDSVLLAAIGSTTANILGIFYIVARYLFPKRDH